MSGETNLAKLLKNMKPELNEGEYVYCLAPSFEAAAALNPLFVFQENEGITVILARFVGRVLILQNFMVQEVLANLLQSLTYIHLLCLAENTCLKYFARHYFVLLTNNNLQVDKVYLRLSCNRDFLR